MNNNTIFKLAIERASKNGFIREWAGISWKLNEYGYFSSCDVFVKNQLIVDTKGETYESVKDVIFSHDFAEAFWGDYCHDRQPHSMQGYFDPDICIHCGSKGYDNEFCWQQHLQRMVLEEEPIQYLLKFLLKDKDENKQDKA